MIGVRLGPMFLFIWLFSFMAIAVSFATNAQSFFIDTVFFGLIFLPVVVLMLNIHALRKLTVNDASIPDFFQNENGRLYLHIQNTGSASMGVKIKAYDCDASEEVGGLEQKKIRVELNNHDRGIFPVPSVLVGTSFPFLFFYSFKTYHQDQDYAVYPKIEANAPDWPDAVFYRQKDVKSEDVTGLRPYTDGDSMSTIDWKASAKKDEWIVREYDTPKTNQLIFSLEQVCHLDKEHSLQRLAAWITRAEKQRVPYCLDTGDHQTRFGWGTDHYHFCLRKLAQQ